METTTTTYPKRVSDLLPGHVVLGKGGELLRVTYARRVRKGVHEVMFTNMGTGLAPRAQEYIGSHEVQCVEVGR